MRKGKFQKQRSPAAVENSDALLHLQNREAVQSVNEIVGPIMDDIKDMFGVIDRYNERNITFQEKLLLLDGATLTLTFTILTALGTLRSGTFHLILLSILIWSWRLLVIAIIFSLAGQALGLSIIGKSEIGNKTAAMRIRLHILNAVVQKSQNETDAPNPNVTNLGTSLTKYVKDIQSGPIKTFSALRTFTNSTAILTTVAAFVLLLLFAQANVRMLAGR